MRDRDHLREEGETLRRNLFGDAGDGTPEFMRPLYAEAVYGAVWSRSELAPDDRFICSLSALASAGRQTLLRRYVDAALNAGLSARSIAEVFVMIGLYAGFAASEEALETADRVFESHEVEMPKDVSGDETLEALSDRGQRLKLELHKDRALRGYAAPENPVTAELYRMATQFGYGEIWFRPGLDIRQRALVAVSSFTALRMESQISKFGQSAVNVGLTRTEVVEAIMQTATLTGYAPALNALNLLSEPFAAAIEAGGAHR